MSPADLPSDDALGRLIASRFGDVVGLGSDPPTVLGFRLGTKQPAPWKREAMFAVNDLRAEGATITEALRAVFNEMEIARIGGSTFATFKRSYEKFRKADLRDHFYESILTGELDEAIAALKFCHDETRQTIWDDLNRDKPPPPSA
jgi:hypothetical protein